MRPGHRPAGCFGTDGDSATSAAHVIGVSDLKPEVDDERARAYAWAALNGHTPEADARKLLGWLLVMSPIPARWARHLDYGMTHLRMEAEDKIRDILMAKCTQDSDGGLDLGRLANSGNLSGWANRLCGSNYMSISVRRAMVRAAQMAGGQVLSGEQLDELDHEPEWATTSRPDTADAGKVEEMKQLEHFLLSRAKRNSRVHMAARCLAANANLRVPAGFRNDTERADLDAEIQQMGQQRRTAVTAVREAVDANGYATLTYPALSKMFAHTYTTAELGRLVEAPAGTAYAIAASAATPRPAVHREVRGALIALTKARCSLRGWNTLASRLVHSFLVSLADLPSEDSNTFATARVRSAAAARRDEQAFHDLAGEVTKFRTAPLGSIPAVIEHELNIMLAHAELAVAGSKADRDADLVIERRQQSGDDSAQEAS